MCNAAMHSFIYNYYIYIKLLYIKPIFSPKISSPYGAQLLLILMPEEVLSQQSVGDTTHLFKWSTALSCRGS